MGIRSWSVAFACGVVFALGLGVSGMTQPQKVIDFLDVLGNWDPSLALVMIGALGVHGAAYFGTRQWPAPRFSDQFHRPSARRIDGRLALGAALFGLGWGLGGFCPGPGIVALTSGHEQSLVFVGCMLVGMGLHRFLVPPLEQKEDP